ncbi:MAG: hypothetical protein JW820_13135, partial [Spirochaetales bacterium]|nr:hypothetical protein [Spirochaetales bacterium]
MAEGNAGLLAREIESVRDGVAGEAEEGGGLQVLLEELEYWQGKNGGGGMLGKYGEAAEAARDALLDLEARIRAYGGADLPADSLEREIARLKAERAYLERQVEIAAAVVDYAEDASPDRPSEAETMSTLARAQEEMAESGQRYAEAVEALRRLVREEVTTAPLELTEAWEALEQARSALDQSRRRYGDAWSAWGAQDLAILQALVEQHDQALERWYCAGRSETYRGYFAAWEAFQAAELADQAEELLRDLLGEGEDDRVPDLAQLQARTAALLAVRLDWDEAELWERVRDALSAAGVDPESSAAAELRAALEAGLSGDLVGQLRAEQQLALLRESARVEQYRYACLAELLGRETLSAGQGEAEIEGVRRAAGEAEAAYAAAREELERQALRCLEGDFSAASPEAVALAELLRLVGAGGPGTAETGVDETGDERFQLDGLDLRELFLEEERLRLREARAVLELYEPFGRMLPLLSSYYRWSDAAAWSAALGVEEEVGELGVLRGLTSSERLVELCGELALLPSAPPYLEEVVVRLLAVAAAGRELLAGEPSAGQLPTGEPSAGEAGTGARQWLSAVGALEVVDDRLAGDLEAYAALVLEALEAFRSPDWSRRATQAEAREAQLAVWSGERSITECLAARLQAEAARAAWAEGFAGYQEAVLEPLQEELAEHETAVARCQAEYDQALARVASVSARYLELHAALEAALAEHTEARLVLQQAEEVHAYASNGYCLEASGPEAALAERRRSLERVAEALEVLRAIAPLESQRPFLERMDPEYRDGKEAESALLEGLQQLVAAREGMESATA